MPVDDAFARHDMAILYDAFNAHGEDGPFYLSLAQEPCRILDVGCGTGLITLPLAARGHRITGVEPGAGMLAVAKAKPGAERVDWIAATAAEFRSDERFDLAVMTAHVFQVFADDQATLAALANIHRHLAPGGRLVFESRNPLRRAWENWTAEKTRQTAAIDGIGCVEVFYQWRKIDGDRVTFDAVFTLQDTGEQRKSESTLRFPPRETIERLVRQAGFSGVDCCGWWDGSPYRDDSPEIIVTACA